MVGIRRLLRSVVVGGGQQIFRGAIGTADRMAGCVRQDLGESGGVLHSETMNSRMLERRTAFPSAKRE